jgi:hypothetical protein
MTGVMQLGDFLSLGGAGDDELAAWLGRQDAHLARRLDTAAAARGESATQFLRIAVADFLAEADQEAWTSLVSALRDADDPAAACVARVADFRLRLEGAT